MTSQPVFTGPVKALPSLRKQAIWLMLAKTAAFALSVVLPMLLVRVFDQSQYGLYKQAFLAVSTGASLFHFSVVVSIFYYLPRRPDRQPQIICNVFYFTSAMGAAAMLLFAAYPRILEAVFSSANWFACAGDRVGDLSPTNVLHAGICGDGPAGREALHPVYRFHPALADRLSDRRGGCFSPSLDALLWAAIAQGIVQTVVLHGYLYSRFGRYWRGFDKALFREQMKYAFPYGIFGILTVVQRDLHSYVVAHAFTTATFAIYAVGCIQVPLIGILRESIGMVLISKFSALTQDGRTREVVMLTAAAMRKLTLVYAPHMLS